MGIIADPENRGSKKKGKKNGGGGSAETTTTKGGLIPDSTVGPKVYSENIKDFLDDANLDPANDPTLQPVVDAFKRESEEDFWRTNRDLRNNLASKNLLGSDVWASMNIRAREEHGESVDQTLATLYQNSRNKALDDKMAALNQINERDIAAGNMATARATARISAQPGMAMARLEREKWNNNKPWENMGHLIDVMRATGDMSGYYESPNYVPSAAPYTGMSPWVAALGGGVGGGLAAYGSQ
jgi:hypothetical protein